MREQDLLTVPDPVVKGELGEPTVWVKRIKIVESLGSEGHLREIPFRLGLNIIAAEIASEGDTTPVGHDVGKTLLIRLIRYCLGDDHFGDEEQTNAIAAACENGYVLAHFRVKRVDWCVARPLALGAHWCRQTDAIDEVRSSEGSEPYKVFAQELDSVTDSCFSAIGLPKANDRAATWRDLLGWISRDQDCNYSHWAEWRTTQSQSGPRSLKRTDAYLVMRMALGLINVDERKALDKRTRLSRDRKRNEKALERAGILLDGQFEQVGDQADVVHYEVDASEEGALQGRAYQKDVQAQLDRLAQLDPCGKEKADLKSKEDEHAQILKRGHALGFEKEGLATQVETARKTVDDLYRQKNENIKDMLIGAPFACEFYGNNREKAKEAGCPGLSELASDPLKRLEWQEEHIRSAEAHRDQLLADEKELTASIEETSSELASCAAAVARLKKAIEDRSKDYRTTVQNWESLQERVDLLVQRHEELEACEQKAIRLAGDEQEAADLAASYRTTGAKVSLRTVSHCYDSIVREILSPNASGTIKVDGRGLRPEISNASSSGTTLRACSKVLGFDLACLYASMCGIGHMPRLWIHDSPRAADTEDRLYHQLMELARGLEDKCEGDPTFQHIWTTTTPPPKNLNTDNYVMERLHARNADGKLLRRNY